MKPMQHTKKETLMPKANQPKDFKPKGQKANLVGRLAKRNYKAPKGGSTSSKSDVYLA